MNDTLKLKVVCGLAKGSDQINTKNKSVSYSVYSYLWYKKMLSSTALGGLESQTSIVHLTSKLMTRVENKSSFAISQIRVLSASFVATFSSSIVSYRHRSCPTKHKGKFLPDFYKMPYIPNR